VKLQLVAVGTKMPDWVQTGFTEYLRRFPKDMPFELVEIPALNRLTLQQLYQGVSLLARIELTLKQDYGQSVWDELEEISLLLCHKALPEIFIHD